MADALASGASVRKGVGVQIPPRAPLMKGFTPAGVGPFIDIGGVDLAGAAATDPSAKSWRVA